MFINHTNKAKSLSNRAIRRKPMINPNTRPIPNFIPITIISSIVSKYFTFRVFIYRINTHKI